MASLYRRLVDPRNKSPARLKFEPPLGVQIRQGEPGPIGVGHDHFHDVRQ
jgi:hypothetical protein